MNKQEKSNSKASYIIAGLLVCFLFGLVGYVIGLTHNSISGKESPDSVEVTNLHVADSCISPKQTLTPLPNPSNGYRLEPVFNLKDYQLSILTVTAAPNQNYYLYLDYLSTCGKLKDEEEYYINDSCSFHVGYFIEGGTKAVLNVPAGTCSIRYATGNDWYGIDNHYFGEDTVYLKFGDLFNLSNSMNELTIFPEPNCNFDTASINEDEF